MLFRSWARSRAPLLTCAIIGLGGLFAGVTGPLLSAFVPAFVQDALGTHRAAIGGVMAIDNILLLVLVPLAGAASDRASTRGSGRLRIVIVGFVLAAIGMLLFPLSPRFGLAGIIAAMIALYSGINIQRAPFQSLLADAVPSRYRSLASGSVTFQMCAGAILFLMLGRTLGAQTAFTIAAVTVVVIAVAMGLAVRETETAATDEPSASLWTAIRVSLDGSVTGMRQIFLATLLLQMTFQMFTTWYALHGMERFGVGPEEVTTGFIAWAVGGVIGALPAGVIGGRIGRRNTMLLGFATLALCLVADVGLHVEGLAGECLADGPAGLDAGCRVHHHGGAECRQTLRRALADAARRPRDDRDHSLEFSHAPSSVEAEA